MVDSLPEVDLSFMEKGIGVIQNQIVILGIIVVSTLIILALIFKVTGMPQWLRRIIFPVVTFGVLAISVYKIYFPNIIEQLGLN